MVMGLASVKNVKIVVNAARKALIVIRLVDLGYSASNAASLWILIAD